MVTGRYKPVPLKKQSGFTYLAILFVIAIVGIVSSQAGINWSQTSQREKESELLFVGNQFRRAISQYYERTPGAVKQYPARLEDLLADERYTPPQHYLRKRYRDPVTNSQQWGLIIAPQGGIMGVHSISDGAPLKSANFDYADLAFEGAAKYADWVFVYTPQVTVRR